MSSNVRQPAPNPQPDLTSFQEDLLVALARLDGSPSGLDIKRELEDAYEASEVNHGRLYPNLDTLVEKGLIEKGTADQRTNTYTLTQRGRRVLNSKLAWFQTATKRGESA